MTIAIVLSGGTGTRLGSEIPKQYIEVSGRPIISYTLETLISHSMIDGLVVVADDVYRELIDKEVDRIIDKLSVCSEEPLIKKYLGLAKPGATRQLSILSGMLFVERIKTTEDINVFVHDAARPCLSEELITRSIEALDGRDGVLPVLPMKDTVYLSIDGGESVNSLLDRSQIFAGQAPEVFGFDKYLDANLSLIIDGRDGILWNEKGYLAPKNDSPIYKINGSTEPAIKAGLDIAMIPGDEANIKITTKADLERFIGLLS